MVTIGTPLQSATSPTSVADLRRPKSRKLLLDRLEDRLWDYYDQIEGISSYVQVLSNTADLVAYYPALEGGTDPIQVGSGTDENGDPIKPTVEEQRILDVWDSIGGEKWMSETVAALVKHLSVPGQAWLVPTASEALAETDANLSDIVWKIWSTSELRKSLGITADTQIPIEDERIWRIWAPHPKDSKQVTSPVRRVANKCEILRLIDQGRMALLRSRLPAGVLPVPARLRNEKTISGKLWADALEDALLAPIDDPESTASLIPLMVYVQDDEAEILRAGPIKMGADDPERLNELEERALRRLAIGIDAPIELITGVADLNHWSAWLIREETYDQHLDPLIVRILRSLTPWWRSLLKASNVPYDGQVIWRNSAAVTRKVNVFDTAVQLWDRFVLSDKALLHAADRDEEDRPDEEEVTRRVLTKALSSPRAVDAVPGISQAADNIGIPSIQASAPPRVGLRLSSIDGAVLARLEREAARQMRKLRRRTTARIAAAAKKQGYDVGDEDTLPLRLGPAAVALLIPGDLVTPDDFDANSFDKIIGDAQDKTAEVLSTIGAPQPDWGDDRDDAVKLLITLLAASLIDGLFRQVSTSGEEGYGGTELVSFQDLRDALNVAGGGQASRAVDVYELVGNGRKSADSLNQAGFTTEAFKWVYGTIPRRTFQPHLDLDGRTFDRWDDPALAVTEDGMWIGSDTFFPGDHRGCRCRYERVLIQD